MPTPAKKKQKPDENSQNSTESTPRKRGRPPKEQSAENVAKTATPPRKAPQNPKPAPPPVTAPTATRRSGRSTAGKISRWTDEQQPKPTTASSRASVASSGGKAKPSKARRTVVKTKKPWEGSDEEEEDPRVPRGFGRNFVFSEEDEDEEDGFSVSTRTAISELEDYDEQLEAASSIAQQTDEEDDELWVELQDSQEKIPPLILSNSSVDLLVDKEQLMDTLEIYEVLKNYGSVLQLSPFLFEDFCIAIRSSRQSKLLCEIHIAFLRLFFREEDNEHTIFAAQETSLSVSILIHLLDPMCFGEVLRHYVESDPNFSPDVLHILNTTNYPFVDLDKRLTVLKWMCQRFFEFDLMKKIFASSSKIKHEEQCRNCGKAGGGFGKLLSCAECEAVFHAHCDVDIVPTASGGHELVQVGQPESGVGDAEQQENQAAADWRCPLCRIHVPGVTDCLLPGQTSYRNQARVEPLGRDRHGRLYWFMVRRIFVQDIATGTTFYYSTLPQLYDLVEHLDPVRYERRLCKALGALLPTIAMQMHTTLELTDERWRANLDRQPSDSRPYIHVDNVHRMSRIVCDILLQLEHEDETLVKKEEEEGEKMEQYNKEAGAEHPPAPNLDVTTSSATTVINKPSELMLMVQHLLCIKEGHLVATFWSASMNEAQLMDYYNYFSDDSYESPPSPKGFDEPSAADGGGGGEWWRRAADLGKELSQRMNSGFRLGYRDSSFLQWTNAYSDHPDLCRSALMRKNERDRRKYLASRFCITDQGEFDWALPKDRNFYGTAEDVHRCLQLNLRRLVGLLPDALMHRRWILDGEKGKFLRRLGQSTTDMDSLRDLLLLYEAVIRRPVFLPIYWQSLAATRFIRITSEQRERRMQLDNLRRREEKALQAATMGGAGGSGDPAIVWVRYTLAPARTHLWRITKDEQYRINGLGALGGWLWVSCTLVRRFLPHPERPDVDVCKSRRSQEPMSLANRKACRLERVAKKLLCWRSIEHLATMASSSSTSNTTATLHCYSANCRLISSGSPDALKAFCSVDAQSVLNALPCYSASCVRNREDPFLTSGVAKAKPVLLSSSSSIQKSEQNEDDGDEQQEDDEEGEEVLGEQTPFPFPKPHDFLARSSGKRSILVLPQWFLKRMARQGGLDPQQCLHFFHQTAKSNPVVWPYPCVRPLFLHCWRYLTQGARSLHALALRLRTLYACIRWPDLEPEPEDEQDPRVWTHQADCDEVRIVIGHKEHPPDGYYEQYLLQVDQYMLEDGAAEAGADDSADYRQASSSASSTTKRARKRRAAPYENGRKQKQQKRSKRPAETRRVVRRQQRWIDGVELKLYEMTAYWEGWLQDALQAARSRREHAAAAEKVKAVRARVQQQQKQNVAQQLKKQQKAEQCERLLQRGVQAVRQLHPQASTYYNNNNSVKSNGLSIGEYLQQQHEQQQYGAGAYDAGMQASASSTTTTAVTSAMPQKQIVYGGRPMTSSSNTASSMSASLPTTYAAVPALPPQLRQYAVRIVRDARLQASPQSPYHDRATIMPSSSHQSLGGSGSYYYGSPSSSSRSAAPTTTMLPLQPLRYGSGEQSPLYNNGNSNNTRYSSGDFSNTRFVVVRPATALKGGGVLLQQPQLQQRQLQYCSPARSRYPSYQQQQEQQEQVQQQYHHQQRY